MNIEKIKPFDKPIYVTRPLLPKLESVYKKIRIIWHSKQLTNIGSQHKDPHKWCYDYEGLKYLLKSSGFFKNIKELKFNNSLASFPFTHNRPETDLCLITKRV